MRILVALVCALAAAAEQRPPSDIPTLRPPTKQAPALTDEERAVLNAGIALLNDKQYDQAIARYRTVLDANPDSAVADASAFLWTYYVPYFRQLRERDFVEPFVYHVSQGVGMPGVPDWMAANKPRVDAFLAWDKAYAWRQHRAAPGQR